ncbi:uncharacterized protein LOC144134697 isoform X2 [Amblyomma americanum]
MAQFVIMMGILVACSPAVSAASSPNCINITINNIFGIGDCLGGNADFCTNPSIPVTKFLTQLVGCTLKGIATDGSPQEVSKALRGIVQILLNSLGLDDVLKNVGASGSSCGCNLVCKDPIHINIGDTGLIGKCVDDAAVFCQAGSIAECLLTALSKQDLVTIATGAICDIVKLFKKADIGVDILTLPVRAGFSVLAGLTC